MEYPRATTAIITYTEDGSTETISVGDTKEALKYEMEDVEKAVNGDNSGVFLEYTKDVMDMMTEIRKQWNMTYPEEEQSIQKTSVFIAEVFLLLGIKKLIV